MTARQIALNLPAPPPRQGRADYLVAASNAGVLEALDAFLASAEPALALCGPAGSGKTHLAAIAAASPAAPIIVDDAQGLEDRAAFFSVIESARQAGRKLLVAGRGAPADWARGLRDLETRLSAMARIRLEEPDEALIRAVILKNFTDRQLRVAPEIIAYAAPRIPRTFEAARAFVTAAEAEMAAGATPITVALARKVVGNLSEVPPAS